MSSLTLLSLPPELQAKLVDRLDLISLTKFRATCSLANQNVSSQQICNALIDWECTWTAEVLALLKSISAAWNENNPSKAWRELQDAFCKRWNIRITEEGVETSIQNRIDATETFMVCYGCLEWLLTSDFDSNQLMLAKEHSRFTKLSRSELLENPFINLSGANRLGRRCFHCRLHSEEAKQNGSPWLHKHQFGYILRCRACKEIEEIQQLTKSLSGWEEQHGMGLCSACYEKETGKVGRAARATLKRKRC